MIRLMFLKDHSGCFMKKSLQKATIFSELDYFRDYCNNLGKRCLIAWTRKILGVGGEKWLDSEYILKGKLIGLTDELECRMWRERHRYDPKVLGLTNQEVGGPIHWDEEDYWNIRFDQDKLGISIWTCQVQHVLFTSRQKRKLGHWMYLTGIQRCNFVQFGIQ